MATIVLKSRWEAWENACIKTALEHKIPQKIMADALGRTATAVSKRIKDLGLKAPAFLKEAAKEQRLPLSKTEKRSLDLKKMVKILQDHAPLTCFQEGHLALRERYWTRSTPILPVDQSEETPLNSIEYHNPSYSLVEPLEYIPTSAPLTQIIGSKEFSHEADYVSLCYIDEWALSEGFHKMKGALRNKGLAYWKDGTYFSQAQLLMHVNQQRREHQLQPVFLIEEERIAPPSV